MTQRTDPETVLRLACERMLLRRSDSSDGLGEAASALIVLAGLPEETAERAVEDYATALALRGQGSLPHAVRPPRQPTGHPPLTAPVVAQAGRTVQVAAEEVHVEHVVHRRQHTDLYVRYEAPLAPPVPGARGRFAYRYLAGLPSITVADDTGRSTAAHFTGSGDAPWGRRWWTEQPLSPTTAWIELEGTRVELTPTTGTVQVRVEPREDGLLPHRYLWHRLTSTDHVVDDPLVPQVLLDAGVLTQDDREVLDAYETVRDVLQRWGAPLPSADGVPDDLAAYLRRRGAPNGRQVAVPMSTLTPVLDGFQAAVYYLRSTAEGFCVDVVVRGPGGGVHRHYDFENELRPDTLAWWAQDDRGNSYLGHWGENSTDLDESDGTVHFTPGLDASATELRIMPTTLLSRAVIEVPLP